MVSTIQPPKYKTTLTPDQVGKLHNQATSLEGVFLNTLVGEMFSSIKTDDASFGGGFGEETWRSMQSEQLSDSMAQAGGVGLADDLMDGLIKMQEASQNTQSQSQLPTGVNR
ncbi:MAG TPA: rod-binding protein [Devosiaceae bacterium]|jgi:flagellar protein FlgJ